MDKKDLVITILGLFVFILLGVGAYFLYSSMERELVNTTNELDKTIIELNNTKNALGKSQEESHDLFLKMAEVQKNSDDLKAQLEYTKNVLDSTQEQNLTLSRELKMLQNEVRTLREALVRESYRRIPIPSQPIATSGNTSWPVLSPVLFDTNAATAKKEMGVAQGPSGQVLDGVFFNAPAWADGIKGRALQFNGRNQYVSLGNILQGSYTNFSIACWVKHPSTSWQNIVERSTWDTPDGIGLMMDYFGQSVDFGHYNNFVKSKAVVQDNQWHFVVGTMAREGDNYIYSIYVDGVLDNTYTATVGLEATTNAWAIGARYNGSWVYQGLIEDVRLYDRTLSASEVRKLYNR